MHQKYKIQEALHPVSAISFQSPVLAITFPVG